MLLEFQRYLVCERRYNVFYLDFGGNFTISGLRQRPFSFAPQKTEAIHVVGLARRIWFKNYCSTTEYSHSRSCGTMTQSNSVDKPSIYRQKRTELNPHNLTGGGGKITPQADLFAAISEPHVVDRYPLVTFPKYVWAMRWHNPGLSIIIQNSNMAAAKPEIIKFSKKSRYKALYLRSQTRYQWNSNGVT